MHAMFDALQSMLGVLPSAQHAEATSRFGRHQTVLARA
jgi:hypothetical protein